MQHSLISSGSKNIGVLEWAGEGETVVLLHGLFDSAYTWRAVAERGQYQTLAFDLPGFGMSDPPENGEVSEYASLLLKALESKGVSSFHLVGHSLGGLVAAEIAARAPAKVSSLLLVAPAGFGETRAIRLMGLSPVRAVAALLGKGMTSNKLLTDFAYTYFVANGRHLEPELLERLTDLGEKRQVGIKKALEALSHYEQEQSLGENFYRGTSYFLWGDQDKRIPRKHIEKLQKVLPQGKLEVWAGAGHHPQQEDPERFHLLLDRAVREGLEGKN